MPQAKSNPGYKHTEVGVIPADWDVKLLGEIVAFLDGRRRPVKDADRAKMRGMIPYYGASGIVDYVNEFLFDEELILLGEDGENIVSRNTPLAFRISGKTWVNNHAHVLKPNTGISIGFLTEALEFLDYEQYNSGTAQPKLNKQTCVQIPLPVPPTLAEQEAIAAALSDADGLIESLEKLIAKKRQIKHGTMQELLTGQRRLPGFTGKWETKRFDQMFSNLRNGSNARSELTPHGEVAYIHYGDIHIHPTAFLNPSTLQTFIPRAKVRALPRLINGDLLLADASEDTAAIGKAVEITGLSGEEAVAGLHTMALRGNNEFLADGFKGYIQYMPKVRNALVSLATGVSVYGITKSGVKAIEVTIPKPAEQSAIASILSEMDGEIASLETKLAKARQIKQGMMQELLTGRIRLI
jgi:type I restriction enzyme S subunit